MGWQPEMFSYNWSTATPACGQTLSCWLAWSGSQCPVEPMDMFSKIDFVRDPRLQNHKLAR